MRIVKMAEIWNDYLQVRLILHTPNNKGIINVENAPFFDRLENFHGEKFLDSINYFEGLQEEIKYYCEVEGFYNDDGDDALELNIFI